MYARIGNLSEGGLFLRTSTPFQQGARAVLRFRAGEVAEVSAGARVVWSRSHGNGQPAGMGLQFDPLDEETREQIRRIIESENPTRTE